MTETPAWLYRRIEGAHGRNGLIQHGEGAHSNHILLAWDEGGIKYASSAHGHSNVNLRLLRRVVQSIVLVAPPSE